MDSGAAGSSVRVDRGYALVPRPLTHAPTARAPGEHATATGAHVDDAMGHDQPPDAVAGERTSPHSAATTQGIILDGVRAVKSAMVPEQRRPLARHEPGAFR